MYIVASSDPNPRGESHLPNPNDCNYVLTSATRGEELTPSLNECKSTLTSGTRSIPPIYIYIYIYTYIYIGSPLTFLPRSETPVT